MSRRSERAIWTRAKAVARSLAPAATWQETLARTFLELRDVAATWVATCPPGFPFLARGAALPSPGVSAATQSCFERVMPRVERGDYGVRMVRRFGCQPFLAVAQLDDRAFAEELREKVFASLGAVDVLHAFLVVGHEEIVGWLSLCVRTREAPVIERLSVELEVVSRLASGALGDALVIAEGCGAHMRASNGVVRPALTERETEISVMIGRGLSDLNIAHRLRISEHTVATHLRHVFAKLGLHSRAELAACAALFAPPSRRANGA